MVGVERADLLRRLVGAPVRPAAPAWVTAGTVAAGSAAGAWALASSRRADSVSGLPQLEQ